MKTSISPRQVARAIGVSESTLKRWCYRGLIPMLKTAGGHRRLAVSDVIAFLRESGHEIAHPELLGLPAAVGRTQWTLDRAREQFLQSLINGHREVANEVITDLHVAGHTIPAIFDAVIAAAFHELGKRWACGDIAVYEERRACEICMSILRELRPRLLESRQSRTQTAIAATLENDIYTLPVTMVELVLADAGWNATSLGSNLPVQTLVEATNKIAPALFCLSVSHFEDQGEFLAQLEQLSSAARLNNCRLIVGGQAVMVQDIDSALNIEYCQSFGKLAEALESPELVESELRLSPSQSVAN